MPAFLRLFTGKGIKSDGGFLCNRRHHIKGGTTMYEKRALSKNQFAESGIDTSDYRFIETEGDFTFGIVSGIKGFSQSSIKLVCAENAFSSRG